MPNREAGRLIYEDYGMIQWLKYMLWDRVTPKTKNDTEFMIKVNSKCEQCRINIKLFNSKNKHN